MDAKQWVKLYHKLKGERSNWETRWQESAEYCAPIYADFTEAFTKGSERGNRQKVNDATANKCLNLLGKTMHSMIVPPGVKWVDFEEDGLPNPSYVAKDWIQRHSDKVQNEFNLSNFDKEMSIFFKILPAFGTTVLFFEHKYHERLERKIFHFTTIHPKECFIADTSNNRVNKFIRVFKLSAERIIQLWPDGTPSIVTNEAKKNPDKEFDILHAVYEKKNEKSRFNFISKYILLSEQAVLNRGDSGYYTFPYLVLRWEPIQGESYGNCPAFDAMPHIKTLNEAVAIQLDNYDKALNPPMLVEVGALSEPTLNLSTLGVNWCNDINAVKQLVDQGRWDVAEHLVIGLRQQIEQMFFIDQLQLPPMEGTPHTAFEIQKRVEFQMRILGPMFGTHNYDFLDPLIERAVDLMYRDGQFEQTPQEILEGGFKPKYVGPLSKSQRLSEAASIEQYLAIYFSIISNAPQAVQADPTLLTMHNWQKIFEILSDARGAPKSIFNDPEVMQANADKLSQLQEATAQAQMAGQGAAAYKDIQTGLKMAQGG
jgi:hypothetical protein